MGYIYKITNDINNKIYIGQTVRTIETRWKAHLKASKNAKTKLALAMSSLGIEHFKVEEVEECLNEQLNEKEIYWIAYYDSFNNGYNSTIGGGIWRGTDDDNINKEIFKLWDEGLSITEIANELQLTRIIVRNRIYTYKNYSEEEAKIRGILLIKQSKYKKTYQWDLNGNLINIYNSQIEAAEKIGITNKAISYAIKNKSSCMEYFWTDTPEKPIIKNIKNRKKVGQYDLQGNLVNIYNSRKEASNAVGVDPSGIGKCCSGNQKTAGGFIWKSIDS